MIKRDCYWYTCGGDLEKKFTSYPPEYGSRCNHKEINSFFHSEINCNGCKNYKK